MTPKISVFIDSEFFGFYEHVHQIDESEDAQDKETCKHRASDLFEPIHTFEIESVAQRTQGAEQQEQHDFIHLFVFLN